MTYDEHVGTTTKKSECVRVDHVNDYHAIHQRRGFLDATASCFHIMENSPRIATRGDLRSWNNVNHYPKIIQ